MSTTPHTGLTSAVLLRIAVIAPLVLVVTSGLLLRQVYYGESLLTAPIWLWIVLAVNIALFMLLCFDLRTRERLHQAVGTLQLIGRTWRNTDPLGFVALGCSAIAFVFGLLGLPLLELLFASARNGNPGPIGGLILILLAIVILLLGALVLAAIALVKAHGRSAPSWTAVAAALVCLALFGPWFIDFL